MLFSLACGGHGLCEPLQLIDCKRSPPRFPHDRQPWRCFPWHLLRTPLPLLAATASQQTAEQIRCQPAALALDLRCPPYTGRQQPRRSRSVPNLEGARSQQPPGRRARRPSARSEQACRSPETGCALTGLLAVPCGKKLARPTPRVSRGRPRAELHRQCRQSEANNMSCDQQKTRMLSLCLRPANAGIH